jgi:hypothetical protein
MEMHSDGKEQIINTHQQADKGTCHQENPAEYPEYG